MAASRDLLDDRGPRRGCCRRRRRPGPIHAIPSAASTRRLRHAHLLAHVHAKDTALDARNVAVDGVLDTKPDKQVLDRSWVFRTVVHGHGEELSRRLLSVRSAVGYDGAVSIEHEDDRMTTDEGLAKAARFLHRELLQERRTAAFST